MNLTIIIDDSKVDEFKEAFLAVYPAPHNEETGEQLMADNPWIKKRIVEWLKETYRHGKNTLYRKDKPLTSETSFIE